MTVDTALGAALFVVALVASVATAAVTLLRSTVTLERWLDSEPVSPMRDQQGDTRAA